MINKKYLISVIITLFITIPPLCSFCADKSSLIIPRLKYDGGGDWYTGPTSMINLLHAIEKRLNMPTIADNIAVSISDPELFKYPMLYLTGHGNIKFKDQDINTIKSYLDNGGFMWINDSYGMEKFVKSEVKKLYPDKEFVQLPANHAIFHNVYDFPEGLPKIHEHDNKPPAAFALFDKGRMKILYLFESDIGDGLEDAGIHKVDTPEIREQAMKMAINITVYAMMQ